MRAKSQLAFLALTICVVEALVYSFMALPVSKKLKYSGVIKKRLAAAKYSGCSFFSAQNWLMVLKDAF